MFNFCFLRIQELWSEFLLNQIRTPWILRFFCVFLSPFVSFLWLHQRLQIGYGKFFRQNTTPCGVEIFPKTHVAWTFHSNLQVYLCHGNVSNGRTEIPAKVHGSDCNQVACPSSWQRLRKREFWMLKSEYKKGDIEKEHPCQWTKKSRDGKPMKQVCIGRDGQMLVNCQAHPTYSCGDCPSADNSQCLSLWPWAKRKTWNVVCLNAFPLVAPKPHSRQPSLSALLLGVANGEVSQAEESARILSGRYSLRYLLANPLPYHSLRLVPRVWDGRKGQHQRRSRRPWGNWRNLKNNSEWISVKGGIKLLQKRIGEKSNSNKMYV